MDKSGVDEPYERYGGVRSSPERSGVPLTRACTDVYRKAQFTPVKRAIEQAALIISISAIYSKINTGSFSHDLPKVKLIEVGFSMSLIFPLAHLCSTVPF